MINRFPATVLALLLYICLWRWKLKNCPGIAISVDHRHRSRYYCRVHIQSMSSLTSPLGSQVDFPHTSERERRRHVQFYVNNTGCSPSLSQILQVCIMQCVGTDRQKHISAPMAWRTKQNLVRATMRHRSVQCVCLPHVSIWNNEPERTKDAMWTAIFSRGAPFLWWEE